MFTVNKKSTERILLFVLGVFSTLQLVEILGVTVFTFLILVYTIFSILITKELWLGKNEIVLMLVLTISELMIVKLGNYFSSWGIVSIRKYILEIAVLIFAGIVCKKGNDAKKAFFDGIYVSVILQMAWAYLQFFLYRSMQIDLNKIIFNTTSQYKNGSFVLTGISTNAGMLVPVIAFGIWYSRNRYLKLLFYVLAVMTGSVSNLLLVMIMPILSIRKETFKNILSSKFLKWVIAICACVIIMMLIPNVRTRIGESILLSTERIFSIFRGEVSDASSYTHMRYYSATPYIISKQGIFHTLFGYGKGCAGLPFVIYLNQYSNIVYVPESDFITFIFDAGIIGALVFYGVFLGIAFKCRKKDKKSFVLVMSFLIIGFFYGIQLNWVILVELLVEQFIRTEKPVRKAEAKIEPVQDAEIRKRGACRRRCIAIRKK